MSTSVVRELRGSCNCGRNTYVIEVPADADTLAVRKVARVVWDGTEPPYLRVPLPWYHSTTYSFFPDETHSAIRRVYHIASPASQRHFCGYCGARVSHWREAEKEKEWMFVNLGTLGGESLVRLEGLGVVGGDEGEDDDDKTISRGQGGQGGEDDKGEVQVTRSEDETGWFERIVETSGGGRVKVSRGTRQEGGATVEWEVVEWTSDDPDSAEPATPGKRKLEAVQAEEGAMEE